MPNITDLVSAADRGDGSAAKALFAALYQELHGLAEHHLRGRSDLTLGTTTLLHEAYLKLSEREGLQFPDRGRFLAYASKAIRGLVIDYSRARRARKRGGEFEITQLGDEEPAGPDAGPDETLERLGRAMEELAAIDPELAQVVDLHFFAGFSFTEIAALRNQSDRTVQRHWRHARMLLQRFVDADVL